MRDRYSMYISPEDEQRLIKWNNQDPVTRWEKQKNLLVKKYQGDNNDYISNYRKITELKPLNKGGEDGNFFDVKRELEDRFSPILDRLPKPIATILLLLATVFVIYMRKRKKK